MSGAKMPFFKRKLFSKNSDNQQPANSQNGVGGVKSPVSNQSFVQAVPPLQNFVPPPDLIVDSLGKSNRRSASTLAELTTWAGGYFSAFLRHEGAEDLFLIWERITPFTEKLNQIPKPENFDDEALKLKSVVEASSTVMSSIEIANVVDGNLNEDDKDCVSWIKTVYTRLFDVLQSQYLPRYLESKFHIKCQVDMFTNCDSVTLLDILLNQNVLFYFMEYVDQEGKREVLEFLMAALNFSEQFKEGAALGTESDIGQPIDFKLAESDAMVLYEKYISLQAPHPLGIRDEVRSDVERLICSKEEIAHCFDRASVEAFAYLQVTCLDGFLKSSLYLAFLSDLIGSLSAAKTPQSNIDSGSISSTASTTSTSHRSNRASLSSPPTQRKTTLSLGRVTSLGKFEADADLEFVKQGKAESSITKTVKKLVNYDEKEKAKEELAWQVAAMIVNEVTSVTMGSGDPNIVYQ